MTVAQVKRFAFEKGRKRKSKYCISPNKRSWSYAKHGEGAIYFAHSLQS